jgi:hypothetical protein
MRAFENSVLRRIYGPRSNEVTRGWKHLHNEEPYHLFPHSPPNIIGMLKSRMRLAWHIERNDSYWVKRKVKLSLCLTD